MKIVVQLGVGLEYLRLGFLGKDDNKTLFLTAAGMGYLLDVGAGEIDTLAEAYAAGFQQGHELPRTR